MYIRYTAAVLGRRVLRGEGEESIKGRGRAYNLGQVLSAKIDNSWEWKPVSWKLPLRLKRPCANV